MSAACIGDKITLKSDKGVFTIISTMKQKDGLMYEVTNGIQTFWTNRANFSDKPKIEQMSLFDFADEIASQKPEEPKVRVYKAGDRFSNGNAVMEIIPCGPDGKLSIAFECNGYRCEYAAPFGQYDIETDTYKDVTDETSTCFAALGFSFWKITEDGLKDLNGDGMYNIDWLRDDGIASMVNEAFKDAWKGNDQISVSYDFRDLFMMKWLGLEKLPSRHLQRINGCIGCKYGKEQKHLMTYYDIEMPFGEFLKFLRMKEDKRK